MPTNNHLLTLFVLGTLSVTLDLDVKLCGQVSLGTEELCFAAVLVYTILTRKQSAAGGHFVRRRFFLVRSAAQVCSLRPRVSEADVVESVASDDNEGPSLGTYPS